DHFGLAPVFFENGPQNLIEIFAVALKRTSQHAFLDSADFFERRVPTDIRRARARLETMNTHDVECNVHHKFRSCPEHACAPERRSDCKAPLGGAEIRVELPQLKESNRSIESFD